ncbi:2-succinyl-5-enolpyruvyl-6-hydroxy-3-cyclohexene-1-carboxylic-acid synthase [Parabacteroides sp. Marseille-P3160]|uniref:2-succinyl-5-enolpyruvyl-6-hydroxy-3- cyclohexene-1-carboxylic-acid synthase n=1 Tax=Parabacteroides sp. Marseille-P3160 TaxID=1917887 RepID=UPI0009B9324D|nr:2-succinyl-5-enolpyruvyl-6-hydroxy-3-cyclohexene-1-carboxylic-acid synthase [Parabacteroides sp. Marseille-P3160]
MYPVKKNVQTVVAMLKAYGIREVVISPGSRNAPLAQCFSQDPFFHCQVIVDERAAAFHALGIAQCRRKPVVACCTSGTAPLNYAPAVAEACYQQLPLVILSADRAPEWIGQMDGQTLPQTGCFGLLVKRSVQLPEINNESETWWAERLCNEALIACTREAPGPVHLNIPISEPLFDYSASELPVVKRIQAATVEKQVAIQPFADRWKAARRRLIVIGQLPPSALPVATLEALIQRNDCVVLTEHLSNCLSPLFVSNFDALLYTFPGEGRFAPDLVVSLGGHIVSKRLKQWLRKLRPEHWLLTPSGEVVDTFQSLTDLIEMDPSRFLEQLTEAIPREIDKPFLREWKQASFQLPEPSEALPFSDLTVTGAFMRRLPKGANLHLANSSPVRNAQLFALDASVRVYVNRGTNGIESPLPTAVGFASVTDEPVYLLIGDLSFFYGLNALWDSRPVSNLRILLINNGGGGIFHMIPGLNKSASLEHYVAAGHAAGAQKWAEAAGMIYREATNNASLEEAFEDFFSENLPASILLEAHTDMTLSKQIIQTYYHQLKNK